ncbi:hypothetical protein BDL97_06G076600 [Sphagnum fallax]|nr:hypothetical protein BDL97_06G076600 [Sphagnum fallax]
MMAFVSTLKLHHHLRQDTRRIIAAASSVLILTCAVVVGFLLIAVWVSSSASSSDEEEEVLLLLDSNTARGASSLDTAAPLVVGAADIWRVWNSAQAGIRRGGRDVDSNLGEQVADKEKDEEEEEEEEETGPAAGSNSEELSAADSETETATSEQSKSSTQQDLQQEEEYKWKSCAWIGAQDYVPCLDNRKSYLGRNKVHKHLEHRSLEWHYPSEAAAAAQQQQQQPKCLIPLPLGYKAPICWPESRDQIWYDNVPHQKLVSFKADQNWMKKFENKLVFPCCGGTQFKDGALQYINFIQRVYPEIEWGKNIRVVLDVGCGVASFGGYLFDKDVITMSVAPKDEHEAQVQLALERGIPALSSVMSTRLLFPSNVFDMVHCAHCQVHWHGDGGMLLLELNRVLRPGGYFVWSPTPVYQNTPTDLEAWNQMIVVTESMSWKLVAKQYNSNEAAIGVVIFQKPKDNQELYETSCRVATSSLPFCSEVDNADAAWYVKMTRCIHRIPVSARSQWPAQWPARLMATPTWLTDSETGIYGKPATEDYWADTQQWEHVVQKLYLQGALGINWTTIRNIMDMRAGYGGFAAALVKQPVWVMNIIPISEPDTLPIIYDRGLIGMYHDWCEPHSTYPRTYDLLHANHIISSITNKCNILSLVMEMDRILRPGGWVIFCDEVELLIKVEDIVKSMHWDIMFTYKIDNNSEQLLAVQKSFWRPDPSNL